jgi:hypothetical protein
MQGRTNNGSWLVLTTAAGRQRDWLQMQMQQLIN